LPRKDSKLGWGPEHLNHNVIVAFDIRCGGTDPYSSDLLEVCFMPLNHSYRPHPEFLPFNMRMRPSFPVDLKVARLNRPTLDEYYESLTSETVVDLLEHWWRQIREKPDKKAVLLGHNVIYKIRWLEYWLGGSYLEIFHETYRDVTSLMHFLNDRADYRGEPVRYKQANWRDFCKSSQAQLIDNNSLMANCKSLSDGYRYLLDQR
jgi:hypothetical protein